MSTTTATATIRRDPPNTGTVPVGPVLSIFDPVYVGIDEFGHPVYVPIIFRNLLTGGDPGTRKSSLLSNFFAHGALSADCPVCLIHRKQVELRFWEGNADGVVGPE